MTGTSGSTSRAICLARCSWRWLAYELMNEIVSASMPRLPKSCRSRRRASSSSGTTTSPRVSMRSTASRVYSMAAGGSGFSIIIQPASGPGVHDRAKCRICLKPCVVISPTVAPLPSSTALVATVVPCMMPSMSPGATSAKRQILSMPASTPTDGSAGVDGVLTRTWRLVRSSNSNRSVNVPPTSTPSLRDMEGGLPLLGVFLQRSARIGSARDAHVPKSRQSVRRPHAVHYEETARTAASYDSAVSPFSMPSNSWCTTRNTRSMYCARHASRSSAVASSSR